jgi:N-acetylmuramoyl-L-alanine amidase
LKGLSLVVFDQNDVENCALCAWKEARGDGEDAMRAVLHVILNRAGAAGFPQTVHDVVYQKNAFTSMSVPSDPQYNLKPLPGDAQFSFCMLIAPQVLGGQDVDLTFGAHYYAELEEVSSGWFLRNIVQDPVQHPFTVQIGSQRFYV